MTTDTLRNHPTLGNVAGIRDGDVIHFRGLKYATLRNGWEDPEPVRYSKDELIDATQYGPPSVAPHGAEAIEYATIQQELPITNVKAQSKTESLWLNITVPQQVNKGLLPVFVFIHGGGLVSGTCNLPHYDQKALVELSKETSQPIISVHLSYRLGLQGFLASQELTDHGIKPNRGLRDLKAALLWLRDNIQGFGGDPDRVTVSGQSAGAAAVTYLLGSSVPLFKNAILFGGSFFVISPLPEPLPEITYSKVSEIFGLTELSPHERVARLTKLTAKEIADNTNAAGPVGAVVDNDVVYGPITFESLKASNPNLPGYKWCESILTVDSQFDANIFALVALNARVSGLRNAFEKAVKESLASNLLEASELLKIYNIGPDSSDQDALVAATQFMTDAMIAAPAVAIAEKWHNSYVCHLNEPNPWEGQFKGRTTHCFDIALLFQNYNHLLSDDVKIVGRALAKDVISFAWGKPLLPRFGEGRNVTVYRSNSGPPGKKVVKALSPETGRNQRLENLATTLGGWDILIKTAFQVLLSG